MKETKNTLPLLIAFLILVVILVLIFMIKPDKPITEVIEINNYEGENLSSVNDFRENSIKGPQYIDIEDYKLELSGLVEENKSFTYDDITNNYQSHKKIVTLDCVEGWSAKILWEGVRLNDIFSKLNIKPEANTVIFHAVDGYTTSFPLSYLVNNNIMIAYKMNDATLIPERGFPFQLVAESKWGYKWIKWITKIEFSNDESYEGYWESRGYSNSGDLDKYFFDK